MKKGKWGRPCFHAFLGFLAAEGGVGHFSVAIYTTCQDPSKVALALAMSRKFKELIALAEQVMN